MGLAFSVPMSGWGCGLLFEKIAELRTLET